MDTGKEERRPENIFIWQTVSCGWKGGPHMQLKDYKPHLHTPTPPYATTKSNLLTEPSLPVDEVVVPTISQEAATGGPPQSK